MSYYWKCKDCGDVFESKITRFIATVPPCVKCGALHWEELPGAPPTSTPYPPENYYDPAGVTWNEGLTGDSFADLDVLKRDLDRLKESQNKLPARPTPGGLDATILATEDVLSTLSKMIAEAGSDQEAKRDAGKPRCDLLPPRAMLAVGQVLEYGARKYAADSWKQVPDGKMRYLGALLRHLFAYMVGERLDPESKLPHLAHAACNALFILELHQTEDSGASEQ